MTEVDSNQRHPIGPSSMAGNTSAWVAAVRGVTEGLLLLLFVC